MKQKQRFFLKLCIDVDFLEIFDNVEELFEYFDYDEYENDWICLMLIKEKLKMI